MLQQGLRQLGPTSSRASEPGFVGHQEEVLAFLLTQPYFNNPSTIRATSCGKAHFSLLGDTMEVNEKDDCLTRC